MIFTKETYAPTLLQQKAARKRKEEDDDRWWCRYDESVSPIALIKVSLLRPFILAFTEPILWFFNIWCVPDMFLGVKIGSTTYRFSQDIPYIWHSLSLLRRVPNSLHAEPRLGPRHCWAGFRRHRYWHHDLHLLRAAVA